MNNTKFTLWLLSDLIRSLKESTNCQFTHSGVKTQVSGRCGRNPHLTFDASYVTPGVVVIQNDKYTLRVYTNSAVAPMPSRFVTQLPAFKVTESLEWFKEAGCLPELNLPPIVTVEVVPTTITEHLGLNPVFVGVDANDVSRVSVGCNQFEFIHCPDGANVAPDYYLHPSIEGLPGNPFLNPGEAPVGDVRDHIQAKKPWASFEYLPQNTLLVKEPRHWGWYQWVAVTESPEWGETPLKAVEKTEADELAEALS